MVKVNVKGGKMQVQSGVKLIKKLTQPCFVFAELWPSWTFSLLANGCQDITTVVDGASDLTRLEINATRQVEQLLLEMQLSLV